MSIGGHKLGIGHKLVSIGEHKLVSIGGHKLVSIGEHKL